MALASASPFNLSQQLSDGSDPRAEPSSQTPRTARMLLAYGAQYVL
jgi:hypothetical protein